MAMNALRLARSAAAMARRSGAGGSLLPARRMSSTPQEPADPDQVLKNPLVPSTPIPDQKKTMVIMSTASSNTNPSSFTSFETFVVPHDPRMLEMFAREIKARGGYEFASIHGPVLTNVSPEKVTECWEQYEQNYKYLSSKMKQLIEDNEAFSERMKQISEDTELDFVALWVIKTGKKIFGEGGFEAVKGTFTLPYLGWLTFWLLVLDSLFASEVPPRDWPKLLNAYRLLQLHRAIEFYKKDGKDLEEVNGLLTALRSSDISAEEYKALLTDIKLCAVEKVGQFYIEKASRPPPNPPAPLPRLPLPDCPPVTKLPLWPCKPMATKPYLSPPLGKQPVPKVPKE